MVQLWGCCFLTLIGLIATVDGRCDGIELTIDNQPLNETVLYKPIGSSGLFVTCQKCDDNINKPSWHSLISQARIAGCNKAVDNVCASRIDSRSRGLRFSTFTPSMAGVYECRINGGFRSSINISVLDPPRIITSPASQIKKARSTPRTLNCEASSYDGQVLYHWEGRSFQETGWTALTDKHIDGASYTTFTASSYQYRCVASNDAGETNSEIANITILTSTINSEDTIVPVGGEFSLTCTSTVSTNAAFSWTRDRMPVSGRSDSDGDTSTLTLSDVKIDDAGIYVCSVRVGTLVVMSDPITIDTVIIDPPVITEYPVGGDVPIGMNITLECKATGRGSLEFSWQRHHAGSWSTISTDSTTSYTATSSGSYRCRVTNEAGSVVSNRTRVNIYGPPTITIQPASQLSTIGMTITLNCEGTGRGLLTYYWEERERRNRWGMINGNSSSALTIRNIQNSNQFRCTVSNEAGSTTSHPAGITILEILTHPQAKLVAVTSTINFTCTSSVSSNVTFSWSHNGRSINGSSITGDTSILTITSVRRSDVGSYVCTVRSGSLSVMSNTATLTVYGPPVITDHPSDTDVPVGESVAFICRASGTGSLVYSWERSSGSNWTTVSNDNTTSYTTDTTLAIGQYMYRCRVNNEAGSVVSNITTVNVYGPPTITTHPASQLTTVSMNVTLNCEGTGRGSITYQWETNNINGGQWMNTSNDKTLVVATLEQSQQYRCVVSNEAGSTRSNVATVTVLKIITHPQDKLVAVNSTVSLTCSSSLSSDVEFSWSHNGRSISGSSTTTGDTSILTITSVRHSDVGSYVCTVRSGSLSVMSNAAILTIFGPPVITTQPIGANVPIRGDITLTCQAIGQDPMMFTWETYNDISNWHAVDTSNTTSYTVRTEADGNFMYRCRVENEAGSVTSDEASINVFGPPRISPLQPQFHAELGKEFQINCTATNILDASMNLTFTWRGPNGVQLDYTEPYEDDSRTATSTLRISTITHSHGGVYQCIVRNGGSANDTTSSEIMVQVRATRPREFYIISEDINSLTVRWNDPAHTHGSIDHFNLYYNRTDQTDQEFVENIDAQSRTYVLTDLKPYTEYSIYVTAVRMIGTPVRPLEGMKSRTVNGKTLAGKPVIVVDSDDKPEWIINSDYSTSNAVNLPTITAENGPFSHLYIIVHTISNTTLVNAEDITTEEILEETTKTPPLFYVAAVIHTGQYRDGYRMKYALGAGDTTTDPYGNVFHNNRRIVETTLFFFRAFSINSTQEREISTTTSMQTLVIDIQREGISGDSDSSNTPSIGVIIAGTVTALVIVIIIIVLSIVLLLICRKKSKRVEPVAKMMKTKSASTITIGSSPDVGRETCTYVVPTSGGSDTDSSFANPMFKIKMESSDLRTSVGQPTTLMIALPDIHRPTITWKKDGQTVNHPVLSDGSLYIVNTTLSDQGRYIVTVNSDGSTESATVQLTVINPQMPTDQLRHKPIKVDKLAKHVASWKADDSGKLEADFESASYDVPATQHAAKLICNISKNRFTNIMPYDHARVVLNHQDHVTGSDYINASFIDGYAKGRAYIAAQGPLNNTVDDFWRMVWEQDITTIVMLTRLVEDAKIKCCQYWPHQGSTDYGSIKVTLQKEDQLANYCVRQLSIKKESNNTYESRVIHQIHFTTWPDHGVPDHPTVMLDFLRIINRYHDHNSTTPVLVHCSAGVGRTGTLIAIDSEIERIKLRNTVNVFECVSRMRYYRNRMVQTPEQYEFIYSALLEYITCGDTSITGPLDNLKSKVEELCNATSSSKKTKVQTQFEKLSSICCKENDFTYAAAKSSPRRNRVEVHLPPDSARISLLRFHGSSDYINACFIDGYHKRKAFLVGPGPMQSTAIDFWTMIWEKKSHVVVMLAQLKENGEDVSAKYWNERSESGDFVIETQSEKNLNKDVVQRIIKVTNTKEISTRIITQLQYVGWSQNSCPSDPTQIVDLIRVLEEEQHKTSNGPITVHCSDGVGRSGTFCALMVCINQFRTEKVVDVFRTIQIMRGQRPGIVGNMDQYKFIHKTLVTVLQQSSS